MVALAHAPPERPDLDQLLQRARTHLIVSPRQALDAANNAVAMAEGHGELANQAAARQVRGDAYRLLGQHEADSRFHISSAAENAPWP